MPSTRMPHVMAIGLALMGSVVPLLASAQSSADRLAASGSAPQVAVYRVTMVQDQRIGGRQDMAFALNAPASEEGFASEPGSLRQERTQAYIQSVHTDPHDPSKVLAVSSATVTEGYRVVLTPTPNAPNVVLVSGRYAELVRLTADHTDDGQFAVQSPKQREHSVNEYVRLQPGQRTGVLLSSDGPAWDHQMTITIERLPDMIVAEATP